MNLKLVFAAAALAGMSAIAQAQQGPPPSVPKPTKADVQRVVQMISSDKTKTQLYCQLAALNDQMAEADQKKDQKALNTLGAQADEVAQKIGPEYLKLMDGLSEIDENSSEGKELGALLAPLDKLCTK
jgi:hypothetical protein